MISDNKAQGVLIGIVVALGILALLFVLIGVRIVHYNEYALEKTFSGKLESHLYDPGFNWLGLSSLIRINNQVRNYEVTVEAASKDYQDVNMIVNMNMVIKKEKVYDFVKNYQSEEQYVQYLNNKVQEKIKTIIIKYDAEEVLNNRLQISKELYESVVDMPELTYFKINDLAIKNIQFSDKFSETLERKAQISIEKEILLRQKENLELLKANMKIVDIDTYFKYQLIEKWDGKSSLIISDALLTSQSTG